MSTPESENRPFTAPTVLILMAIAGGCWAVTVQRMPVIQRAPVSSA